MISKDELLKGRDKQYPNDYTQEISDNLDKLLVVMNVIRAAYGKPMTISSGWRSPSINAATTGAAKNSAHCIGLAADIVDSDGVLLAWVLDNLQLMQDNGVYLEDPRWCPNWIHFGLRKPNSGKRIFVPSSAPASAPDRWDGQYESSFDG